jgi:hypothetical protein
MGVGDGVCHRKAIPVGGYISVEGISPRAPTSPMHGTVWSATVLKKKILGDHKSIWSRVAIIIAECPQHFYVLFHKTLKKFDHHKHKDFSNTNYGKIQEARMNNYL